MIGFMLYISFDRYLFVVLIYEENIWQAPSWYDVCMFNITEDNNKNTFLDEGAKQVYARLFEVIW